MFVYESLINIELCATERENEATETGAGIGCVLLNDHTRSGRTLWSIVSPAAGEKERPDQVRLGLASQKELNH